MNFRPIIGLFVIGIMGAQAADSDGMQRLIPWNYLAGKAHPDEATLASADWTATARHSMPPRQAQNFNGGWVFNYFPAEQLDQRLVATDADDKAWPIISLPHTWSTFETTREVHPFIARPGEKFSKYFWNGWGVYRKNFIVDPKNIGGRRVFAEFDGASKYCRVFLNGVEVGEHNGSYASFSVDLTPQLKPGNNVLAVAVSNRRDDIFRTPPMNAGNWDVYGGITRDVRLLVTNPVHIPFQGSNKHEGGTFVTTPEVSAERATVRVRTWVKNDEVGAQDVRLRTIVRDPAGKSIAEDEMTAKIAPGEIHEFDQAKFTVDAPQLWSPETPVIYSVESQVSLGDKVVDRYASPLGFRWFEWNKTENRGYLNGKLLHIHGTNRHEEFPWLGSALPKWISVRDMADIRFGQGHNFMRTAHYTNDSLIYDLTDRFGIMTVEEVPSIKDIQFDEDVQRQQVVEMIRRDRNHPSIVMWSMGNETNDPASSDWAHEEDDTRLVHLRRANNKVDEAGSFVGTTHENIDMENLLRCTVRGWTDTDVANFTPQSGQSAGTEEWQHTQAMVQDASQRGRIDMPNGVMWLYADHGADRQQYLNCPLLNLNPKGWVDLYRIPKYIYWLWKANYVPEPMVFVHPQFWQKRYIGQQRDFVVDSNCDSVELFVDGQSRGTLVPNAETFWNVTFKGVPVTAGELKVVGKKGDRTVVSRLPMPDTPSRLTLTASQQAIDATRSSVVLLTVDVTDANGTLVPEFDRELRWEVRGPAKLITPDVYTSDLKKNLQVNGSFYIVLPVSTLIRSTGEAGEIEVTVQAEGVAPASVKIAAQAESVQSGLVNEVAPLAGDRQPVSPATEIKTTETTSGPAMPAISGDIVLPAGKDRAFYKFEILKWFSLNNPGAMKRTPFEELSQAFIEHLMNNQGLIVADDFNHRAEQFNNVCALEAIVKASRLPQNFAKTLGRAYSVRILRNGEPLRVSDEEKWIKSLPVDARVEIVTKPVTAEEAFATFYPDSASLPADQKAAVFAEFEKINSGNGDVSKEKSGKAILYKAKSPLLVPTLEQLIALSAGK